MEAFQKKHFKIVVHLLEHGAEAEEQQSSDMKMNAALNERIEKIDEIREVIEAIFLPFDLPVIAQVVAEFVDGLENLKKYKEQHQNVSEGGDERPKYYENVEKREKRKPKEKLKKQKQMSGFGGISSSEEESEKSKEEDGGILKQGTELLYSSAQYIPSFASVLSVFGVDSEETIKKKRKLKRKQKQKLRKNDEKKKEEEKKQKKRRK